MMMDESLHICDEGGEVGLGSSKLAAGVLSQDCALPDQITREGIADNLLAEAAWDGTLADIWDHAGVIAIASDSPDALDDFLQDWT